jgi:hypothetical protein
MGHYAGSAHKLLYNELPKLTLEDVKAFNQRFVKDQPKTYVILGDENNVDFAGGRTPVWPCYKTYSKEDLFIF